MRITKAGNKLFIDNGSGWVPAESLGLTPGEFLGRLVTGTMKERGLRSRSEAFSEVQKKYPNVTREYREQWKARKCPSCGRVKNG
jgi:hypothetical protein